MKNFNNRAHKTYFTYLPYLPNLLALLTLVTYLTSNLFLFDLNLRQSIHTFFAKAISIKK